MNEVGQILCRIHESPDTYASFEDNDIVCIYEKKFKFSDATRMMYEKLCDTNIIHKSVLLNKLGINNEHGMMLMKTMCPNEEYVKYTDFHLFCKQLSQENIEQLLEKMLELDNVMYTIYELKCDEEKESLSDSSWGVDELDYVGTPKHISKKTFWDKIMHCIMNFKK